MSSPETAPLPQMVLTLSCPDRRGIVAAVASFLTAHGCNILDSAQFRDPDTNTFFMRVCFEIEGGLPKDHIRKGFASIGDTYAMGWRMHDLDIKPRVLIMVSRHGHCLNDLLFRYLIGALRMEVAAVVSNHRDFEQLTVSHNLPFHHMPVKAETRAEQEAALMDLIERERVDLVVLARYMQVLSDGVCRRLEGRIINIHHSFLPSFKGAQPYQRAHARGVKLIGATAHYVTPDLDEGPIIEQEVARVTHAMTVDDFIATGRDVEATVLARAVTWHLDHRVLLNGDRTVVFR